MTQYTAHPSAIIDLTAQIGAGTMIGANVVIGPDTIIGVECDIQAQAVIGANPFTKAGQDRPLQAIVIGDRCRIGVGAVIQNGIVRQTTIGVGCWINNLCNIGHDVQLGDRVVMGLSSSISGHSTIGAEVRIGPGCTLNNRSDVGARAVVGIGSLVLHPVAAGTTVMGRPAEERSAHLAQARALRVAAGQDQTSRQITRGQGSRLRRLATHWGRRLWWRILKR